MFRTPVVALSLLPLLAACATPVPPNVTTAEVAAYDAAQARVNALPSDTILPTGSATYAGQLSGPVVLDGNGGYALLGDIGMTLDFARTNSLTGTVANLNLIRGGVPDQLLEGNLTVTGTPTTGGLVTAVGSGLLSGVFDDSILRRNADVTIALAGGAKADGTRTAIAGTWTGGTTNDTSNQFVMLGAGQFYADPR